MGRHKTNRRGKGEGTVFAFERNLKRKDGSLYVYKGWEGAVTLGYDENGRQRRKQVYGKTYSEALAKLDALRRQVADGTYVDSDMTVKNFLLRWLDEREGQVAERTIKDYRYTVEHYILPRLGPKLQLAKLTPLRVQTLISEIDQVSGSRTANLCRSRLFTAMKQAVRWQLVIRNPVEAVDPLKEKNKRVKVIWTPEESVRFLSAARPHRLYALFYTAMATGLRHGELINLHWEDVDGAVLRVRKSKTPKGHRAVSLSLEVVAELEAHRARQVVEREKLGEFWADTGLVFTSEVGTRLLQRNVTRTKKLLLERARRAWRVEAEAQGDRQTVKLIDQGKLMRSATVHDLRNLNVSIRRALLKQDAKLIADQVGHVDPAFTMRLYAHLFEDERRDAGVSLSEAFGTAKAADKLN